MIAEDMINLDGFKEDWERLDVFNLYSKQQYQWSMVAIRDSVQKDDDLSVFPPINHENLHTSSETYDQQSPLSLSSSASPSPSESDSLSSTTSPWSCADTLKPATPTDCRVSLTGRMNSWWWDVLLGALRSKILKVASWIIGGNKGASGELLCSSFCPGMGVAILVIWWWMSARIQRRRRRWTAKSVDQLTMIIREKDEKILGLLHQIVQMNEALVAHHKDLASKLINTTVRG